MACLSLSAFSIGISLVFGFLTLTLAQPGDVFYLCSEAGLYPHPDDCTKFFSCASDLEKPYTMTCAPGTAFNSETLECDTEANVECVAQPVPHPFGGIVSPWQQQTTRPPWQPPTTPPPWQRPTTRVPWQRPTTRTPWQRPTTRTPWQRPTTRAPWQRPTTRTPWQRPTTRAPWQRPTTRTPWQRPTTRTPWQRPTTRTPWQRPTTRAPWQRPTTRTPWQRPTTRTPWQRPTTRAPWQRPTTRTPWQRPTTRTPWQRPTTRAPWQRPTTRTPWQPLTPQPIATQTMTLTLRGTGRNTAQDRLDCTSFANQLNAYVRTLQNAFPNLCDATCRNSRQQITVNCV